jgi:polygalacturonase
MRSFNARNGNQGMKAGDNVNGRQLASRNRGARIGSRQHILSHTHTVPIPAPHILMAGVWVSGYFPSMASPPSRCQVPFTSRCHHLIIKPIRLDFGWLLSCLFGMQLLLAGACGSNSAANGAAGSTGTGGRTGSGATSGGGRGSGGTPAGAGSGGRSSATGGSFGAGGIKASGGTTSTADAAAPDGALPDASGQGGLAGNGTDGGASDVGVGWDAVPAILARIVPPTFPNLDCDITQYGGVGDGTTDNTAAFAKAIQDCSSKGGGRVVVPAGTFFTGPIEILSNINLYVSAGATIKFTTDPSKYLPNVEVSWEGSLCQNYHPLVWAHDATNVAITGTGTIDGNASNNDWYKWSHLETTDQTNLRQQNANGVAPAMRIYGDKHYLRPGLIEFIRCTNVLFDGFTAKNSPFWTVHPVLSTNVTARNFHSEGSVPNTDGFDPESCTDVLVQNATLAVGDDALAIKAGRDRDGHTYYKPSQNIVIENSTMLSRVGGLTIGSEMSGGVQNVYMQDCTLANSSGNLQYGYYIKSAITRGGFIKDIYSRRITVGKVQAFFYMTGHYVSGTVVGPTAYTIFNNINVDTATVAQTTNSPFFIAGSDASLVATDINLSNITVKASPAPALDNGSGHYKGLTTTNVVVNGAAFNPPASKP